MCMAWLPCYSCLAVKILTRMRTESPSWITARVPRGRQKRVPAITLSRDHRCPTTPSTGAELWGRWEKGKKLNLSQILTSWTTDGTWGLGGLILNSFLFFPSSWLFSSFSTHLKNPLEETLRRIEMSFRIEYLRNRGPPKSLGVGIAPRVAHRDRFSQPGLKGKHLPLTHQCNCAVYSQDCTWWASA